jgi:hypothetical protein
VSVVPGGAAFGTDVFSQNGTDNFAMVVLKDMGSVIFSGLAVPFAEFTNVLTGSIKFGPFHWKSLWTPYFIFNNNSWEHIFVKFMINSILLTTRLMNWYIQIFACLFELELFPLYSFLCI